MTVYYYTSCIQVIVCVFHVLLLGSFVTTWPVFCPESCSCGLVMSSMSQQQLKTVSCNGERFMSPPSNMSSDTESLILPSNHIQLATMSDLASYTNLTEINLAQNHIYGFEDVHTILNSLLYLNLDSNEVDYFPTRSFWWVPRLCILTARNNKLELMHANAFDGLHDLHSLVLSGNRLCSIIPDWFVDLHNLRELDLGDNNIHTIRDNTFKYLQALQSLDLRKNQLNLIHDEAFLGMMSLRNIILSDNNLKTTPLNSLHKLSSPFELNLSNNPLRRLDASAFANMSLTNLNMSHMNHLDFIDSNSFLNLPVLDTLDISHNKRLLYMDPATFYNVPKLKALILRHNNLSLIEEGLVQSLPSIKTVDIEGNGLFCDCDLWWILDEYKFHPRNLSLPQAKSLLCDGPATLKGKSLDELDESLIARSCAPRILPLFDQEYHIDLGDPLRLDCRAVGNPAPQTDWLLPIADHQHGGSVMVLKSRDGKIGSSQRITDHISVSEAGTVVVDYAQGTDSGVYRCLASNLQGRDERVARVHVRTNLASVIIMRVSQTSVTITWRSRSYTHHYQILYHRHQSNQTYHIIDIEPYMRSYTANDLSPHTGYQFCIAMKQGENSVKINCTVVLTKREDEEGTVLFDARWYIMGGGLACVAVVVGLACTAAYFIKRYNKRKRIQEELYSDNLSQLFLASMDSMSDTTPITYENRGAEMFDDDDIEEIRSTASMPSCSTST